MQDIVNEVENKCKEAKSAARKLALISTEKKNNALLNIADNLVRRSDEILAANKKDLTQASASGMGDAMLDRLLLNRARLEGMAQDVRAVAALPDPVGEVFDMRTMPNGLRIGKKRVPLGVIAAVFESRPNVTIDISALCLKAGNAVVLRGGKEAVHSNVALANLARQAATEAGLPGGAVQLIQSTDRAAVGHLLKMRDCVDLLIPRGGAELIRHVSQEATMPVVTGGIGVCHIFVDRSAQMPQAVSIAYNAKVQRPTVCNALDCLLVHADVAPGYLPLIAREWASAGVEIHGDKRALSILAPLPSLKLVTATDEDWGKEFLSLTAAVKVVDTINEALEHIERYGSGHSEAIVTEDYSSAMRFLDEVDAACVYVNASTRFTDGGQFGLGAEVGISTQKLHARGPLGLKEITTYKWLVFGSGQVRP
jgi:glutamate-5-semialdehyde dehydrogenase